MTEQEIGRKRAPEYDVFEQRQVLLADVSVDEDGREHVAVGEDLVVWVRIGEGIRATNDRDAIRQVMGRAHVSGEFMVVLTRDVRYRKRVVVTEQREVWS